MSGRMYYLNDPPAQIQQVSAVQNTPRLAAKDPITVGIKVRGEITGRLK